MQKSREAFRTISEVAEWLDTPAHVLRFWESRFPEVAPVKRAGGRRYYRPADMLLLGGIKHLLHTEGHTIKSVQDRLKSEGVNAIGALAPAALPGEEAPQSEADGGDAPGQDGDPAAYDSEIPPIGFFFDDSDDADPAEAQSGTFAQAPEMPAFDGSKSGPAPEAASKAPEDATSDDAPEPERVALTNAAPDLPSDPDDDDPAMRGAPVPVAAALRALRASDLPPSQRDALPDLMTRLSRLAASGM